jgi:hypothetical protein
VKGWQQPLTCMAGMQVTGTTQGQERWTVACLILRYRTDTGVVLPGTAALIWNSSVSPLGLHCRDALTLTAHHQLVATQPHCHCCCCPHPLGPHPLGLQQK